MLPCPEGSTFSGDSNASRMLVMAGGGLLALGQQIHCFFIGQLQADEWQVAAGTRGAVVGGFVSQAELTKGEQPLVPWLCCPVSGVGAKVPVLLLKLEQHHLCLPSTALSFAASKQCLMLSLWMTATSNCKLLTFVQ